MPPPPATVPATAPAPTLSAPGSEPGPGPGLGLGLGLELGPGPGPGTGTSLTVPRANRLLTTFAHFLTVCIHNILYYRALYPSSTFLTSRAYNLPVHQSRHPTLCAWIQDAVDAARAQIALGAVERLAVVVYSGHGAVMERWMFDIARFSVWDVAPPEGQGKGKENEPGHKHDDGEHVHAADDEEDDDDDDDDDGDAAAATGPDGVSAADEEQSKINWIDVDEQLRAAVRRLAYASETMAPLPSGCTFTVAVELRDEAEAPIGHPQPWVPTQPNLQTASKDKPTPGQDVGGARTTPLRFIEAGPLFFDCWVEEGKAKFESPLTMPSNK